MTRHTPYKTCPACGANLDWGERCDCQKEDHKRARCPLFVSRLDMRGESFILCMRDDGVLSAALKSPSREERDKRYEELCCDNVGGCPIRAFSPALPAQEIGDKARAQAMVSLIHDTLRAAGAQHD